MFKGLPFLSSESSESSEYSWEPASPVATFDEAFARDVEDGFAKKPKRLASRWFYDDEGSRLFSRIMDLPAYYPTARETEILETHSGAVADLVLREPWCLVEMGAGDGRKTRHLLRALMERGADFVYRPVDVSEGALDTLCGRMKSELPGLVCAPMVGDNLESLGEICETRGGRRVLVLFLGSSVGNSSREEMESQLRGTRRLLANGDAALIGFDLVKDPARLRSAYNDDQGLTREFNMNLLRRMNRELGANFDLSAFQHQASWNPWINGMESWLVATREQTVYVTALNREFKLAAWEPIHTEISLKFDPADLERLAARTGFQMIARYEDRAHDFADALWLAGHRQ